MNGNATPGYGHDALPGPMDGCFAPAHSPLDNPAGCLQRLDNSFGVAHMTTASTTR
jgi:hypothetical protein